jgi:hypothetical protein
MSVMEVGCENRMFMELPLGRIQWRAFLSAVLSIRFLRQELVNYSN